MYEHRSRPPLSRREFGKRVFQHFLGALVGIGFALCVGIVGYHSLGGLPWIDSLVNASMILGGMGPVDQLHSDAAKYFASIYALLSGLLLIGVAGVMFAPFAHRLLHVFHWEEGKERSE